MARYTHLPVSLLVENRPCLVVGGGAVAARKVEQLLRAGAAVTVAAPELCEELVRLRNDGRVEHLACEFDETMLDQCILAVAATGKRAVNRCVSESCRLRRLPVNVVDDPTLCTFIMPSVVDRSPVLIAVSTGGASPVLARVLRARLETMIPAAYGRLASLMKDFRGRVRSRFPDVRLRRRFWEHVLQGPVAETLFAGREAEALSELERQLETGGDAVAAHGEVYLVGAGPGDPDLLTFRALRLMQQADVVLYDRLVAPEIVDLCRRDAERIYVGKERDRHSVPQDQINELLIRLAREGRHVLRLKGGDPFMFGRGGEEIDQLSDNGIPFQVVPGITAAAGCGAYAGIPLTHRDYANACVFVTGHMRDGRIDLNWDALVQPRQTVAVYMGVSGMKELCGRLIAHGMDKTMPAALIQRGTTPHQHLVIGTVSTLPGLVESMEVKPPALTIFGEVVKLHEKLDWYKPAG